MAKKIVCIDAGHGGKDSGAVNGKRYEKDDVLRLAKKVGALLDDYVIVKYTRTSDIYEAPSKKASDGNSYGADLFISIHRNSASASACGYETLVRTNSGMRKIFADYVNAQMKSRVGFRNRGTKIRADLAVLNQTKMPAVLSEVGFISNKDDNKIFDEKFATIARVLANGALKALGYGTPISYSSDRLSVGDKVKIKSGAVYGGASYGKKVPLVVRTKKYTVGKIQKNVHGAAKVEEALLKEINSWVAIKYLKK